MGLVDGLTVEPASPEWVTALPRLLCSSMTMRGDSPSRRIGTLIVDDHPVTRLGLRTLLAELPELEVRGEAQSLEEARACFLREPPALALVDLKLKDGSGLDLIREQRTRCSTRFVVLTMFGSQEIEKDARAAGAHGFADKGSASLQLATVIRTALAGTGVMSAADKSHPTLSAREIQVVAAIAEGLTNAEIATRLNIGWTTVRTHVVHILDKLGAQDRTEAAVMAVRRGLVDLHSRR